MIKLAPFLLPTEFCDSDNPRIKALAHKIVHQEKDPIKQARLIKEWVGDHIIYRFDFLNVKASRTLKKGRGQCTNRTNLQIAFLRALGVAAGYAVVIIRKELYKPTTPPEFYKKIAPLTTHVYCAVYDKKLEKWRHFDAHSHKALHKVRKVELRYHTPEGEARYKDENLASEICIQANLDHLLKTPPRWLNEDYIKTANEYLENLERSA